MGGTKKMREISAATITKAIRDMCIEANYGQMCIRDRYERGKVTYPLKIVGKCGPEQHGTKVTFLPDKEIFEETVYDYDTLKIRLRETAFLTKNLKIILKDNREDVYKRQTRYNAKIIGIWIRRGRHPPVMDVPYFS